MGAVPPFQRRKKSSGAVLLSYASADAPAADKIGEALRSAGAEVWIDKSGEGGAAAGEAEVRQRIKDCLLFVPIISEHTQEGNDGTYRREWQLADKRAQALGKVRPFLMPVIVDGTDHRSAFVPDSFLSVPWTRLPGGETPSAFCEQVKRLLADTEPFPGDTGTVEAAPGIPDYELLRLIGSGSYGDVWLARGVTGIHRAVKVVWRERLPDAAPFEREFRGLKQFAAISVAERIQLALLHVGRSDETGFFYYVMELADDAERGRKIDPAQYVPLTLAELRSRRGRLPAEECVGIGVELARAAAGLHAHGLVHRDIKPSNVILVEGVAKLADIGLVTAAEDARTFVGTDGFVPPEGPGSPAADVFALGRLLYELSTGLDRKRFPQLPANLEQLPDRRERLRLNDVILRACDPRPERRHADGQALLADLLRLQAGRPMHRAAPGRLAALLAIAAVLALAAGWMWLGPRMARIPAASQPTATRTSSAPALEKSLVVLPLENLSPDPANAFFTDGMQAEIIAALGLNENLRVISRRSAQYYRDHKEPLAAIGRQLGVAYVITGSVRRAADRARIQLELRRAGDETVLWTQTYDRRLRDVMAVQIDIADQVARVLQARSAKGITASAGFMTKDPRAYDLYMKARNEFFNGTADDWRKQFDEDVSKLEEALRLDPGFASAASLLGIMHSLIIRLAPVDAAERAIHAAAAKRWAERAAQMMPGGGGDGALAYYYLFVESDNARALIYGRRYLRARPNEEDAHHFMAMPLARMGRVDESLKELRRAVAIDPRNVQFRVDEMGRLALLRRRVEWEAALAELRSITPPEQREAVGPLDNRIILTGELPALPDDPQGKIHNGYRMNWLRLHRRFAEALVEIDTQLASPEIKGYARWEMLDRRCDMLRRLGRAREAEEAAQVALEFAEKPQPGDKLDPSNKNFRMAFALAGVGRFDEAIATGRRWVEASRYQLERWERETGLTDLYATCGRKRECIALIARLLRVPSGLTVPLLRLNPDWDPVRADPEFQALLNDPRNNEPL